MTLPQPRQEVMRYLEDFAESMVAKYLKPVEKCWQPSDFLPDSQHETFFEEVKELQERVWELDYEVFVTLVADSITEEALPSYESWLAAMDGIDLSAKTGWAHWVRAWTAEENRHGDVLSRFLYLSGRVNMREMEATTQHLLADGHDIGTGTDPYKNFVYTSFQEIATNLSHRRVAKLAKKQDNPQLATMCHMIAADEARHAQAYMAFVKKIFEVDPSEMMLAFEHMMRNKIVMPAHYMREFGEKIGEVYIHFSNTAQRLGIYTAEDYVKILENLLIQWEIDKIGDLNEAGEKARDYLMRLPARLARISERLTIPDYEHKYKWVAG